ncbi:hypothetical protein MGYG_08880 [Nannizzia gypsea CBS 118893]|uniref:Uncharacterized protein n=1 Tax=Arthroderma gypseum (strain ATCC MYA-4604 / CBS 118893) TaxID=535722 RepID=E5R2R9_ARTGP|nr:hypothetical protein MGYG_08880 [Nannizzia gypsea CBS 118893]EFQ97053.1 hypothetical protein MGYG_08880 [Nannizzia gypsea CBS 118893]
MLPAGDDSEQVDPCEVARVEKQDDEERRKKNKTKTTRDAESEKEDPLFVALWPGSLLGEMGGLKSGWGEVDEKREVGGRREDEKKRRRRRGREVVDLIE